MQENCFVFEAKEGYKARLWRGEGVGETEKKKRKYVGGASTLSCILSSGPHESCSQQKGRCSWDTEAGGKTKGGLGKTGFHWGGGMLVWGRKKVWRDRHMIA